MGHGTLVPRAQVEEDLMTAQAALDDASAAISASAKAIVVDLERARRELRSRTARIAAATVRELPPAA